MSDDYSGMSVNEMRKLLRKRYPICRGAFASDASEAECRAILSGQRKADDVVAEHYASKAAAVTAPAPADAKPADAKPADDAPDLAEGKHGDDDGDKDDADGEPGDGGGDDAKPHPVLARLDEVRGIMQAIGRHDLSDVAASAKLRIDALTEDLQDANAALANRGPEQGTDLEATGDSVMLAGVEYPAIEPEHDEDGDANPMLAYVPAADPHFAFAKFRTRLDCGATVFRHGAHDVLRGLVDGDRIMLVGPPGVGKTAMIANACARMRWPMTRFNGNRDVTAGDFVGTYEARNGATEWVDGPLVRAMKQGHVLVLDEYDHMPSECSSVMHSVLEHGGSLTIVANGGEVVRPHANFRVVATANTGGFGDDSGLHPAAQVQDAAMRSRFDAVYHVDYMDGDHEAQVLVNVTGIGADHAERIVEFAHDTRTATRSGDLSHAVSLRETIAWARMATRHADNGKPALAYGLAVAVLGKVPATDATAMAEMAQRHFGDLIGASVSADK